MEMYLKETGFEGMDCVKLAQDSIEWWAVVNLVPVMNLWVS
jgi:hypothetical protein